MMMIWGERGVLDPAHPDFRIGVKASIDLPAAHINAITNWLNQTQVALAKDRPFDALSIFGMAKNRSRSEEDQE